MAVLKASGKMKKGAARILEVSPRTVEFHRRNMMRKLSVASFAEVARSVSLANLFNPMTLRSKEG